MNRVELYDILSDGVTVWVNGEAGLLGRFGKNGIDVHRPMTEQQEHGECLYCTHSTVTLDDWRVFQSKMEEHFGIIISDKYMPKRFR